MSPMANLYRLETYWCWVSLGRETHTTVYHLGYTYAETLQNIQEGKITTKDFEDVMHMRISGFEEAVKRYLLRKFEEQRQNKS